MCVCELDNFTVLQGFRIRFNDLQFEIWWIFIIRLRIIATFIACPFLSGFDRARWTSDRIGYHHRVVCIGNGVVFILCNSNDRTLGCSVRCVLHATSLRTMSCCCYLSGWLYSGWWWWWIRRTTTTWGTLTTRARAWKATSMRTNWGNWYVSRTTYECCSLLFVNCRSFLERSFRWVINVWGLPTVFTYICGRTAMRWLTSTWRDGRRLFSVVVLWWSFAFGSHVGRWPFRWMSMVLRGCHRLLRWAGEEKVHTAVLYPILFRRTAILNFTTLIQYTHSK